MAVYGINVSSACSYLFCVQVCTAKMNLSDEVDLEDYVSRPDKISAAEVSICFWSLTIPDIFYVNGTD